MKRLFRLALGKRSIPRDIEDELAFHIEARTQKLVARGLTPAAAREEALRQFGDMSSVRDDLLTLDTERETIKRRNSMFEEFRQDLAYGLRTLRRNPGFTAVVVLTLALGIGANTAIFTLINAVLLRQLPLAHPEQLVIVGTPTRVNSASNGTPRGDMYSYQLYKELRADNPYVTGLLADGRTGRLDLVADRKTPGQEVEHPRGRLVSSNYFSVLGISAERGRLFGEEEERTTGGAPVIVISHEYWTRRFAASADAVNRTVTINGAPYTIVGITQPGFKGVIVGTSTDLWIPVSMQPQIMAGRNWVDDRSWSWLLFMGRLAPNVTIEKARAGFDQLVKRAMSGPEYASGPAALSADQVKALVVPVMAGGKGFSRIRGDFKAPLLTLMVGVGLLLLIVCANVANLLLARAVARDREMSVRLALGAGRGRLVRQLLTESTALAVGGAALGLVVAWWASQGLLLLVSGGPNPIPLGIQLDTMVLAFTGVVALFTVVLFGLAPALRATRVDLATTMRSGTRSVGGGMGARGMRLPFAQVLIASQVALSVLLLVSAGLLVRSLSQLENTDTGLDRQHLIVADVEPDRRRFPPATLAALDRTILARLRAIPGVAAVTVSENGIFSGTESASTMQIEGFTPRAAADTVNATDLAGPGYFAAIGARMLAGRDFDERDNETAAPVAVINESMARFYFGGVQPALGKMLRFGKDAVSIVGVVADARDHSLRETPRRRAYFSFFHGPIAGIDVAGPRRFELRTTGDPVPTLRAVRAAITEISPDVRIFGVDPLSRLMGDSLAQERLLTRLALAFGLVALVLSAVGLYGVMSYSIARRTGELGLRVALGAQTGDVVGLVFREAFRLVAIGALLGLPLAYGAAYLLRDQLHGVGALDPQAIGSALAVLLASAVIAVGVPVWRAARVAPLEALRQE